MRVSHKIAARIVNSAAANQTGPKLKEDFLDTERRWLFLARNYEVTQRLGDFSDETKQQAANYEP
jgi:hypothetical protein